MSEPIRIIIADDHPLFREGVAQSLSSEPGFTVVGQAGSGEEACSLVGNLLPDVLLLDVTMPGDGGIVTAGVVTRCKCPQLFSFFLTYHLPTRCLPEG